MTQDEIDAAIVDAERDAQHAAEARLADVNDRYWREMDDDDTAWDDFDGTAPYCGCDTCLVREILIAAWPALRRAARLEAGLPDDLSPGD